MRLELGLKAGSGRSGWGFPKAVAGHPLGGTQVSEVLATI